MMPKQNPKHQRKTVLYERQHELQARAKFPKRYLVMGIILVSSITIIVVLFIVFNPDDSPDRSLIVEDNDVVDLYYKLWTNPDKETLAVVIKRTTFQENPSFVFNISKGSVINGFYYEVLGMTKGESQYFPLPANVDELPLPDGDGIDDITGKEILSYGDPSHELFNTSLVYWVSITNITKHKSSPSSAGIGPSESLLLLWIHRNIIISLFIFNFQSIL
jgi:hypothetical protein